VTRAPELLGSSDEAAAAPVHEPHWPAVLAILAGLALYLTLPDKLTLGPTWVVAVLEGALLVPLALVRPHRTLEQSSRRRRLAISLTALVTAANAASLALLVHYIVNPGGHPLFGRTLVFSAIDIWVTNVVVFALWFWELDRGGPAARCGQVAAREPDFLFPQMSSPEIAPARWRPMFVDYAFVSFTNASAFSPTDTMPLTGRAKALMLAQAAVSILTVVIVASRAVNVLA
jgi:hypothetical protein